MIFDTAPLLSDLEPQLAASPHHRRALSAAIDREDDPDVLCAHLDVDRHLHARTGSLL
jgi:hypothetical protein